MPRKRDAEKGAAPVPRIRENSRLMRTHESMMDIISGRESSNSFLDVLAPAFFGYNFLRPLEDDLIYSDSYDDDDDDDYDHSRHAAKQPLQPHPQIKQLTEEEADKIAKDLIEEEERFKGKTEKNKRKKMRKKEKKRLEKENAIKDNVSEVVQGKSNSSEDQEKESPVIENTAEASEFGTNECSKSQNKSDEAGCDKHSDNNEEEIPVKTEKKEDEELKNLDLDNSSVSPAKSVPEEETCNQEPTKERKEEKSEILQVQQPEEAKPKAAETPEAPKTKDEKQKTSTEKTVASAADDYAKRSVELASMGNRLAASGQYEIAVRCFTDAIKFNPKEYKLFGNRSLCYERMQQYENALRDADLAVSMEPNWIKGLFRKGKALCGLKRYYEASLVYKEVLKLESTSVEALQELKRAQTLHLMEMGFTWGQSSEALKTHATLEEAVEALFAGESNATPGDVSASSNKRDQAAMPEEEEEGGDWTVLQPSRPRINVSDAFGQSSSKSQSPTPRSRNSVKLELFSVWVGFLAPAVTYTQLHELFSRTGTVYSIKMLLEHQCAFVNYTSKEDCERAIQCINGMVVEGAPLTVRYPYKNHSDFGASTYKKECFFWRTTGCTRSDCTYKHVPENKNIDRDKFTSRLGYLTHAGN
ncbi:eukaryotic translation initiation factor 5B [Parambassis ranga]|uniref:Eukaryotic translation initiation factor 5B n=1 Tax=Parambassis ranga TaxID=210632 RepID=A0A6P7H6I3_9TELE|nr:eukaryotic translation initiation factor 5B-like [Parambassis ranga]